MRWGYSEILRKMGIQAMNKKTVLSALLADVEELQKELAYLRWFHSNADFGPSEDDVRMAMQKQYEQSGSVIPEWWKHNV